MYAPHNEPEIGHWYESEEWHNQFEVVAYDNDAELIEIQFFDGEIEEIDLETWGMMHIHAIEEPEDWRGALEISKEDLPPGYLDEAMHPENWSGPLTIIEPANEDGEIPD